MPRFAVLMGLFALLAATPVSIVGSEYEAFAQSQKKPTLGPSTARIKRNFEQRALRVAKDCDLAARRVLVKDMLASYKIQEAAKKLQAGKLERVRSGVITDNDEIQDIKSRYKDAEDSLEMMRSLGFMIQAKCDPYWLYWEVSAYKSDCERQKAKEALMRFERIVENYRRQLRGAKLGEGRSAISVREAEAELRSAEKYYNKAKQKPFPKCDEKDRVGAIDSGGETITLPGISEPAPELPISNYVPDFDADELFEISENSAWLLGDWVYNAWEGGQTNSVLRFRLESDGTISGYLVSVTNEMAQKGYSPGMQILRGIRDTSHTIRKPGNTWSHSAAGGETYSPKDPNREPGQIYGQSEWFNAGVIFVDKETQQLGGSTGFQNNRLNWHRGTLSRPNLSSLQQAVRELSTQVERLSRPGSELERLEELPGIIERLEESGQYSREAREAAQIMRLLLERENLINDPLFRQALYSLEDGEIEIEDLGEFANAIVGRTALLGQAVVNNTYDDDIAASMFLHGVNGARIHKSMESQPERYSRSTREQLAQHLATLRNAAGSAGTPSTDTASQLMNGLRDLSTLPAGRPGPLSILDLPAHTAAAVLEQTKAAFGHGTNALKGVGAAIAQGDTRAFSRATPSMRAFESTLSGPGYVDAVKRSITDRIVRYVPFAPKIASWFK